MTSSDLLGLELDQALSDTAAWFAVDLDAHDANMSKAIESAGNAHDRTSSFRLHVLARDAHKSPLHVKRVHSARQRVKRGAA